MTMTNEEKIEILSDGNPFLLKMFRDSDSALNAAWADHERKQEAMEKQKPKPRFEHPEDVLVPDDRPGEWAEQDDEIEAIVDGIDIIAAYDRWCGKQRQDPGGRRENIKCQCPDPSHVDENKSAWFNLDKQVYACGTCTTGGDKFDIAAWYFGYDVPGYKSGKNFPDLRRDMAEDLGYKIVKTRGGQSYIEYPEDEPVVQDSGIANPAPEPPESILDVDPRALPGPDDDLMSATTGLDTASIDLTAATVTHIFGEPEPVYEPVEIKIDKLKEQDTFIDWESMDLEGTFLGDWLTGTSVDHVPDEYNFWMGVQCLGFATRMNVLMADEMSLVKPGLYVVLYGSTGIGKSRSMAPMLSILRDVLPWPSHPAGVQRIGTPGSGEALIDSTTATTEVTSGTMPVAIEPTNVWLNNDEFGTLTAIANRKGSTLKTALMEMHDIVKGTGKDTVSIYSRSHGNVTAKDKFFQITSTVQPKVIGQYTNDMDLMSGFLNRWIFAMGNGRRRPQPRPPAKDIASATIRLAAIRDWADTDRVVHMTDAAYAEWADFYHEEIMPAIERSMSLERDTSMLDSFMARMELTLKKLCLFFAINEQSDYVEQRHVIQATALAPYLRASMLKLNGDFIWTFSTHVEEAILEYLSRKGDVKMKQITDALKNRFTRTDVNKNLQTLLDLGVVKETVIKGKRGPGGVSYQLAEAEA